MTTTTRQRIKSQKRSIVLMIVNIVINSGSGYFNLQIATNNWICYLNAAAILFSAIGAVGHYFTLDKLKRELMVEEFLTEDLNSKTSQPHKLVEG